MTPAARLHELLRGRPIVVAPGAYDGLTGRLIASAGFNVREVFARVGAAAWDARRAIFRPSPDHAA